MIALAVAISRVLNIAARLPGRLSRSHESRQRRCCAPRGRFSGFVTLASRDRSHDQTIAPIYARRAIESAREESSTGSRPAERLQWPRLTAVRRCRHASVSSSTGRDGSTAARTSSRRSGHVLPGCSSDCRSSRSRSARPSQFRRRRRRCFVKPAAPPTSPESSASTRPLAVSVQAARRGLGDARGAAGDDGQHLLSRDRGPVGGRGAPGAEVGSPTSRR